jgi:Protein of unknown function (DUF1579)
MSKSKFEISKESGPHLRLATLAGSWQGNTSTWFEKDILADEAPMHAKISILLDGRFINYAYSSTLNGKPYEGIMTWAYDLGNEKCQCSWVDSFHMGTAIMHSEGQETSNGFSVTGKYGWIGIGEPWSWRTELEIINPEQFIIRAFNISPEGDEAKATETIYHRVKL